LYDYLSKNNWIKNILATDISLDGTMKGPNKEIYKNIISLNTFKFIASGGIGSVNDLHYLKSIGADECVVGKAIYEKKISMMDLKNVN
jgi:phosphoribosylformimino-5-aminoimidazole carboxamide ribotide isomerase